VRRLGRWLGALLLAALLAPGGAAADTVPKRLAVLRFTAGPGVKVAVSTFSARLQNAALKAVPGLFVMTETSVVEMLQARGRTLEQCEGECAVETGRLVDADFVVAGTLSKIAGRLNLSLQLFDTAAGQLLGGEDLSAAGEAQLLDGAMEASARLFAPLAARVAQQAKDAAASAAGQEAVPAAQPLSPGGAFRLGGAEVEVSFTTGVLDGGSTASSGPGGLRWLGAQALGAGLTLGYSGRWWMAAVSGKWFPQVSNKASLVGEQPEDIVRERSGDVEHVDLRAGIRLPLFSVALPDRLALTLGLGAGFLRYGPGGTVPCDTPGTCAPSVYSAASFAVTAPVFLSVDLRLTCNTFARLTTTVAALRSEPTVPTLWDFALGVGYRDGVCP
jgi:hypothetical protein